MSSYIQKPAEVIVEGEPKCRFEVGTQMMSLVTAVSSCINIMFSPRFRGYVAATETERKCFAHSPQL